MNDVDEIYNNLGIYYYGEIFKPINYNGKINDNYYISTYGRIYSFNCHRFLIPTPDKDGYLRVGITTLDHKYKTAKIHRLMMMTFYPIDNFMDLEVNHKDGVKYHNWIGNLEWVTPLDNTRHGWDTGLNKNIGINNGNAKIPDAEIQILCKYIDKGYRNCDICNELNVTDKKDRMRLSAIISSIRRGESHRNISSQYNFGSNGRTRYSLEFAHLMSNILQNNNLSYVEIMDLLEIPEEDRLYFKVYIDDLVEYRTAKLVTQNYKINKPRDI